MSESQIPTKRSALADWLGLNRASVGVLIALGGLGLAEELWRPFLPLYLKKQTGDPLNALWYTAVNAFILNLLEGFGYILGGMIAHKLGARVALAVSALPMTVGFALMLSVSEPWAVVLGALLITNWEPLSVPATFEVVGSEVPKERRTIAFALQSIQKRLPKVIGPLCGGLVFAMGYWVNLWLAIGAIVFSVIAQALLLEKFKPKSDPDPVPLTQILREMPKDVKALLFAEVFCRWGDWFARDFAVLYVVAYLGRTPAEAGMLVAITSTTALITYIPVAKIIDQFDSPKPFIALTFFLFALFPILLATLPHSGLPVFVALCITFAVNGLREIGEPARKAMIATSFPPEIRARAVGIYWGTRSFALCIAPLVAYELWAHTTPELTMLVGGGIGMLGFLIFTIRLRNSKNTKAA